MIVPIPEGYDEQLRALVWGVMREWCEYLGEKYNPTEQRFFATTSLKAWPRADEIVEVLKRMMGTQWAYVDIALVPPSYLYLVVPEMEGRIMVSFSNVEPHTFIEWSNNLSEWV